jgi:hypothetical protein
VVHPEEGLPVGVVSVLCHEDDIIPGIQGDCKVTAERMAQSKDRYKMETEMSCFSPAFS